ncbi:hypothetical protein DH2020_035519 [Rehmannia glutinosa]|uniref:Uncharacterized protein n=1 Tax=Rehmannia glutinosa TaxID=99300 RepID=A0ABR0V6Z0_REHGL
MVDQSSSVSLLEYSPLKSKIHRTNSSFVTTTAPFSKAKSPLISYGTANSSRRREQSSPISSPLWRLRRRRLEPTIRRRVVEEYREILPSRQRQKTVVSLAVFGETNPRRELLHRKISLEKQIVQLASKGDQKNAVNVVLTASDVAVAGFCVNRCGTHGSKNALVKGKNYKFAYIWVGNSETKCPGYCAWPFHQPIYGQQSPPLVAPNNDVGLDGMVMSLGGLLAGTATNPFGNGFYQGPSEAPLEAATACPGVYAKGAYPGYAGDLLVDPASGASYNAHGANGRKYLLPAIYDPSTSKLKLLLFASMANLSTSSSILTSLPHLTPLPLRLDRSNFQFWKAQVLSTVRAYGLDGLLFGTDLAPTQFLISSDDASSSLTPVINPDYTFWLRRDQLLLSWMLASISESMFGYLTRCSSSAEVWQILSQLFQTQSKARGLQLKFQLQTQKKGDLSIADFILKMRTIADDLHSVGQEIPDDELAMHIFGDLVQIMNLL